MVSIENRTLEELKPYPDNPRRSDKGVAAVQRSIESFGFLNPIIIDQDDVIICGHTRYQAAKNLSLDEVPTIKVRDLTPEQERAFRIVDNKVSESAEWDKEMLREELMVLKDLYDMTEYGFKQDDKELAEKIKGTNHECPRCGHQW